MRAKWMLTSLSLSLWFSGSPSFAAGAIYECPGSPPRYTNSPDHPDCRKKTLTDTGVTTRPTSSLEPERDLGQQQSEHLPPRLPRLSTRPFPDAVRTVPLVLILATRLNVPSRGNAALVNIRVRHAADGARFMGIDRHFGRDMGYILQTAVAAAAKALNYDPGHISVSLSLPVNKTYEQFFFGRIRVSGGSAGIAYAVAVASGILGDELRPGVCLTGGINLDLRVVPVAAIEDKLEGCRQLRYREMIIPAGQKTLDVSDKAFDVGIKIIEVSSLAEAYAVATSQELRRLR